jgi:hypothetical protein
VIRWLNPAALAGLVLIAAPVIIHFLRAHRADRLLFPTLRFVCTTRSDAIRLRLPSDWPLLFLRVAIVGSVVLSAAQPIALTTSRRQAWNARTVRAVVIDTSASMRESSNQAAAQAATDAESHGAFLTRRFEGAVVRESVVRATAWLSTTPPARSEIVVISDFQEGTLQSDDLRVVPPSTGLRFVRVGGDVMVRTAEGLRLFGAGGIVPKSQRLQLSGLTSSVVITGESRADDGLQVAAADASAVRRLLRTVAKGGAPSPDAAEPLRIQFDGGFVSNGSPRPIEVDDHRWMLKTVLRLRNDTSLADAARATTASRLADATDTWTIVVQDRVGQPLVKAAALGRELLLKIAAPPDSFFAAVALRAALIARHGDIARPELEIARLDSAQLTSWTRLAGPVADDAWQRSDRSDARWFWGAALLLLTLEQVIRRSAGRSEEVRVAA